MSTTQDDADHVEEQLHDKVDALIKSSLELTHAFARAADDQVDAIVAQMKAVDLEKQACIDRIQDIAASKPFARPGQADDDALLQAIEAVGAMVGVNAAIDGILAASDQLIEAFKASSTNP